MYKQKLLVCGIWRMELLGTGIMMTEEFCKDLVKLSDWAVKYKRNVV